MIRIAVILVALAACVAGIRNGMVLDDAFMLAGDARLSDASQWGRIVTEAYWASPAVADLYRPLMTLSLAIQNLAGGGSPVVFRVVSYLLYCGAALTFLAFARRLLPPAIAAGVALLFAAHPVHVEAVAAAVSQNELIVAMLTMAAVLFYRARRLSQQGLRPRDWLAIAGLYAVAALFKENGLVLPGFLILTELLVPGPPARQRATALWKGYAALALVMVAVLAGRWLVLHDLAIAPSAKQGLGDADFITRALTMLRFVPHWIRLLGWPQHLRADYSPQEFVVSTGLNAPERLGLGLLIILVALTGMARRHRLVCFSVGWIALALLPVSNVLIPTGVLIAERTLFLPSVGFMLLLGALSVLALERWPSRRVQVAAAAATAVLLALGVWRSAARHPVWASRTTLAESLATDSPGSWWSQWFVAQELFKQGRVAESRSAFEKSILLANEPWLVRNDYAQRLRQIGDEQSAMLQLEESLNQRPRQKEAIYQYVAALIGLGRYRQAGSMGRQVLQFPDAPPEMMALVVAADRALATNAPAGSIRIGVAR
jgi:hypothetical protein